jgi:hypothetical protein
MRNAHFMHRSNDIDAYLFVTHALTGMLGRKAAGTLVSGGGTA